MEQDITQSGELCAIMKTLLQIIILFSCLTATAQHWTKIPGTDIEFSNFTNPNHDNWFSVHFEYFRKDQNVIGVTRGLTEQFYVMLQEAPIAFDSIFNNLKLKTTKSLDTILNRFDSSILKIDFKEAAIIESWDVTIGYNEIIWRLKNYTWSSFNRRPCFTNIVFTRKEKPNHKFYNLIFLAAIQMGCEI
ncbi:MAG: hypothetical protein E6H07_14370 [Bacteroidetes bacterium]|nr:MAG: hypothetical protein E6H07_14370 [Bacteroidota bacterium]